MKIAVKTKKWMQLLGGFALLWGFIFLSPFLVEMLPALSEKLNVIREKNIKGNALFYTETPQSAEAGIRMKHR